MLQTKVPGKVVYRELGPAHEDIRNAVNRECGLVRF